MKHRQRRPNIPGQFRDRAAVALTALTAVRTQAVVARHARLHRDGEPMLCVPGRAERRDSQRRRENPGTDGKVIYDDEATALACAAELEALGLKPQRAYPCGRSRHGHYHLATDTARLPGRGD
jgi:hypothetical protein